MTLKLSTITGTPVVLPNVFAVSYTPVWTNIAGATITNNITQLRIGEYLLLNGFTAFSGTATGGSAAQLTFSGIAIATSQSGSVRLEVQTTNLAFGTTISADGSGNLIIYTENTGSASVSYVGSDFGTGASGKVKTVYFKDVLIRISDWIGQAQSAYGAGLATSAKPGLVYRSNETTITVSCAQAGFATTRAVATAYMDNNSVWRMTFNLVGTFTSASVTAITVSITGTVFKTGFGQAVNGYIGGGGSAGFQSAATSSGTGNISVNYAATFTTATSVGVSGDVELDAKPSWA